MAMIYCSQCGKQISDLAPVCPQCGAPQQVAPQYQNPVQPIYMVQPVKPKIPGRGFAITSMVLGIIGVYYAFGSVITSIMTPLIERVSKAKTYFYDESGDLVYGHNDTFEAVTDSILTTSVLMMIIFTFILGALALIFGVASHNRGCKLKKKTAGIAMGIITLIVTLICAVICMVI